MAWVAGDQLQGGKYTIERELGRGRFGITYLVKNKNGDRSKETSEGFTPPELYAKDIPTGAYSDIYSLAATLYVLLTGKTPVSALKRKIDNTPLVEPKKHNPEISDRTNRAILTAMKLDPKQRSQSMREWLDSLGLMAETPQPGTNVTSNTNSNLQQQIQVWGVVIAAIAAIGTLLAGMGAVMDKINKPSPPSSPASVSPIPSSSKTP